VIEECKIDIKQLKQQYGAGLKAIGMGGSDEAVDSLLASVSGADIVDMGVAFKNVKSITSELEKLTNSSGESLEIAEKYYGMYVILLKVLNRMQTKFIRDVDAIHTVKLQAFIQEAQAATQEAKSSIKKLFPGDPNVKILENNIHSNEVTVTVANMYTKYLAEQQAAVLEKNTQLQRDLNTAVNTHITRNISSLLRTGNQNFDALMNLTMPVMRVFHDEEMQKEFRSLSSRITKTSNM